MKITNRPNHFFLAAAFTIFSLWDGNVSDKRKKINKTLGHTHRNTIQGIWVEDQRKSLPSPLPGMSPLKIFYWCWWKMCRVTVDTKKCVQSKQSITTKGSVMCRDPPFQWCPRITINQVTFYVGLASNWGAKCRKDFSAKKNKNRQDLIARKRYADTTGSSSLSVEFNLS